MGGEQSFHEMIQITCHMYYPMKGNNKVSPSSLLNFMSITTDVVSSNLDQGEVYNIMW
jgi:hypothetical protein